jgi:predicted kinase
MMLMGIPGSGKSTVAEDIASRYDARFVSTDELRNELTGSETDFSQDVRVFAIGRARIEAALAANQNVVYDATNLTRADRRKVLKILPADTYKVCYFRKVSLKTAIERNINRKRVVPLAVIERMYGRLMEPAMEEGWDEIIEV